MSREPPDAPRFVLRLGVPGMQRYWQDLVARHRAGTLDVTERETLYRVSRAFEHLREDPLHPGLRYGGAGIRVGEIASGGGAALAMTGIPTDRFGGGAASR